MHFLSYFSRTYKDLKDVGLTNVTSLLCHSKQDAPPDTQTHTHTHSKTESSAADDVDNQRLKFKIDSEKRSPYTNKALGLMFSTILFF